MICPMRAQALGPFHVHRGHEFEGFQIERDGALLVARCACGEVLDVADSAFARCPECGGEGCIRCGGSGEVVDHAALVWRAPDETEDRDANDA